MAKVEFKGELPAPKKENRLNQGDFVFCLAETGAHSFWGIFDSSYGIISLDGASNRYVNGIDLYLGEKYNYWTIIKRVPCQKMKVTLEEIEK